MRKNLNNKVNRIISTFLGVTILTTTFTTASLPVTDIPVHAAGTWKNLQLGVSSLTPVMTSEKKPRDPDTKNRITHAKAVYYGTNGNGTDRWRAIGCDGTGAVQVSDTVTLLADSTIETGKRYKDGDSNSYVESDIRKILIGENGTGGYYASKFDSVEKSAIVGRKLLHGDYNSDSGNFCDGISDTSEPTDMLWLLSTKEADLIGMSYRTATTDWWTRSPGEAADKVADVSYIGEVEKQGMSVSDNAGVRPAFNINLSSIIFTSAAINGKSSGTVGADALTAPTTYDEAYGWKLTLLDSSRSFFATRIDSGNVLTGNSISISYEGATIGEDEYVSAILLNASGDLLYYGRIEDKSSGNVAGTANITIPTGLVDGTYTIKVFSEQYHTDKKTDYASAFSTIDITIGGQDTDKTISGLCTGAIANPTNGNTAGLTQWTGSYVYYGKNGSHAMKYRVLDKAATLYNTNTTMLLDCDSTVVKKRFDADSKVWANSEIKSWLNGNEFYGSTDVFTAREKAAIASSTKSVKAEGDGNSYEGTLGYAPLSNDYIFLLDVVEATRPLYGYKENVTTEKSGISPFWWLRSPTLDDNLLLGGVSSSGAIITHGAGESHGVSPTFNLDLSSVIFSSLVSGTAGSAGAEYKLTVKDANMIIAQTSNSQITRSGNTVTVPYTISGTNASNATQVSVLLTDSAYTAGTAATTGYSYQKINVSTWGTSGTGTFTLPNAYANKTCGTDYYAYILAEDVNGTYETDYASVPVQITIPAPTYTITMSDDGHGTASANSTSGATGTQVTITATPASDYHFKRWQVLNGGVTLSSTSNPATFDIGTANVEIKAIFKHDTINGPTLRIVNNGVGTGISKDDHVYFGTKTDGYVYKESLDGNGTNPYWRVLDPVKDNADGNKAMFVMAESLWGTGGTYGNVTFDDSSSVWQQSDAQGWCSTFKNAVFSANEVSAIKGISKTDDLEYLYRIEWDVSSLSNEQVFFLSAKEVSDYISTTEGDALKANYNGTAGLWWLRSPFKDATNIAGLVLNDGSVSGVRNVYDVYAARPAFNINLESVILTSAAVGGKDAGSTIGTLKQVADDSVSDWKLTIHDSSRNGFTASAGTGATLSETEGYNSWTVPVTCTDAPSGTNEHISAILTNSAGVALYYGHIQDSVTIPTGLSVGNYTLNVFSEQCNGDKKTDYSSPISKIELSVRSSHNHSYSSSVIKEPTCTETGTRRYTCSCGYSYTETIPALGHDYVGKITKYASAQEDGIMTYTCSRCHDSYTESIPKHEPTLEEGIEEIKQLIGELEGDDSEQKVEVKVETVEKEDGTTETIVTVGDEEILKITTDEDGEEEIESNIWSIGGDGNFTYTGVAIKPEILVFDGLKRLSLGSDFTVSYKNNVNAGAKAEAKVSFKGGYKGTPAIKTNFTIDQADLEKNAAAPAMIIASTGKTQKPIPEITITESGKSLGKSDLEYTYLDSEKKEVSGIKDAGDYTVEAGPKKTGGNLTGKITVPITVTGDKTKLLSNGKINLAKKSYIYTGKPIIPDKDTYSLTIDGTKLTEGKDYTLTVSKNIEPGKATMIFTAADGNEDGYVGSIKAVFTITKGKELKPAGDGSDFKYSYEENAPFAKGGAKPEVIVMDGDHVLTKDEDYKVSYDKNKKITEGNTAVMTVTGKGNYKGKVTLYYAVVPQDIAKLAGGIEVQDKAVSSKGYKNPTVTITDVDGKKLKKNTDFELTDDYSGPDENGNVTVTIKGKDAYMGTVPVTYRYLEAASLIDKVNASKIADKTYTGSPIRLTKKEAEKLLYTGKGKDIKYLTWKEDFEIVRYENNIKPGTAKVILRGIGTHGGTRTVTFKIKAAKKNGLKIIISKLFSK